MASYTTNYNLAKPLVGGDSNQWGTMLNANMDTLDTTIKTVSNTANSASTNASAALARTGGTMTGFVTLHAKPSNALHAASKSYVDDAFLPLTGGSLSNFLTLHAKPSSALQAATKNYVDDGFMPLNGATMTGGFLTLAYDTPASARHAAPRDWVLNAISSGGGNYVPLSGNSAIPMSGPLILYGTAPTGANEATPKSYVDGLAGPSSTLQTTVNDNTSSINNLTNNAITRAGGTLNSGATITLGTAPTADLQAATKAYVDARVLKAGDTMTGNLSIISGANQMQLTLGASGGYFYGDATVAGWTRPGGASINWSTTTGNFSTNGTITGTGLNLSGGNISSVGSINCTSITSSGAVTAGSFTTSSGNISTSSGTVSGAAANFGTGSLTCGNISSQTINATGYAITGAALTGTSLTVGSGSITCGTLTASIDIVLSSDMRIKEDVRQIRDATNVVNRLRGVSYIHKDTKRASIGVIAQEVEQVIPSLVHTDERGYKAVSYANMVGILIEAIKELSARIDELEAR